MPQLTTRLIQAYDAATLLNIDNKAHAFALEPGSFGDAMRQEKSVAMMVLSTGHPAGFIICTVDENVVDIERLSIDPVFLEEGVLEKLLDPIVQLGGGTKATLQVSENDIGTPLFVALTGEGGFRATGLKSREYVEYGEWTDAILLERVF